MVKTPPIMELTPTQRKKLEKLAKVVKSGNLGVLDVLVELDDKVDKKFEEVEQMVPALHKAFERVKGEKGDKGDDAVVDEEAIVQEVLRRIPTPTDGKDADEEAIVRKVVSQIKVPVDGKDALVDYDRILSEVMSLITIPEDGKDGSPDTAEDIRNKLELLTDEDRLDASAIRGLDKREDGIMNRAVEILDKRTQYLINKQGGSGVSKFTALSDVPQSYASQGGKAVRVNAGETGLEFFSASGSGTVTSVGSVDGSVTVTNPTTTPDLSVVSAPKLATARTIAGVSFDGTANISLNNNAITNGAGYTTNTGTVTAISVATANGVSGTSSGGATPALTLSLGAITPSSVAATGTVTGSNLSGTNTGDQTTISGNAGTATKLLTARAINGVNFDGTAAITVPAAAGTLTGTTLNATVVSSSLTSVGTIATGVWQGTAVADTYIASAATWNAKQNAITLTTTGTSGAATLVGATLNIPNYATSGGSPLTTKGDLYGFDTAGNRIPVGANGNVLTADSTQTLGVKWAPASGAPAGSTTQLQYNNAGAFGAITGVTSNGTSLTIASGDLLLSGATSGTTTLNSGAVAGTSVLTLPVATDTLVGKATTDTLTNKTMSGASNTFTNIGLGTAVTGTLLVGHGGTGIITTTPYALIAAGTTATGAFQQVSGLGSSGNVLTSNGTGALPSWQPPATSGTVTSVAVSGGTTGLTTSGGPITTTGTITLAGTLAVANGGTGVTSSTGSGSVVLSTSPTLVTPTLGVATSTRLGAGVAADAARQLYVSGDVSGGVATIERTNASTNAVLGTMIVKGTSTGIMADGFGSSFQFAIQGSGVPETLIANIQAIKAGSGSDLSFVTANTSGALATAGYFDNTQVLNLANALPVASGGTGATSLTGVVIGNGTSAMTTVTAPTGAIVGTTDTQTLTNKTLTTPKIAQVNDANNNPILGLLNVSSAVNYIAVENAATGTIPIIASQGSDANVGIIYLPKNNGLFSIRDGNDISKGYSFSTTAGSPSTLMTLATAQTANRTITLPDATDTLVGKATTDTLTNKRTQPRTNSSTTASTLAPDLSSANVYFRTTQTAALTISAPVGTPVIGETIAIYVDSAAAQTLTINATYIPFGAAFPATTTAGKTFMLVAQYNGTNWKSTWSNAA